MEAFLSRTPVFMALLGLLVVVTLGLVILFPAVAPMPMVLAAFLYWVCQQPVRKLTLALFAAAVTVDLVPEVPYEGRWQSPLYFPGKLLFLNLSNVLGVPGLGFPLLDIGILGFLALYIYRRVNGIKTDPLTPSLPTPLVIGLLVLPATIAWLQVFGIFINGGNSRVAQWQWHQMAVLPLMVALFNVALKGPEDLRALGRIIVVGCCTKACLGAWFIVMIARPRGYYFEYATTHSDSILYVTGLACVIYSWLEDPTPQHFKRMLWVCAIIFMGMHYNDRRMAYVSFMFSVMAAFMLSAWSPLKRRLMQVVLILMPFFPFYLAVGWQNPTGVFGPVGIVKSVIEGENLAKGQMDYRDIENLDVIHTWEANPVMGRGWGHEFDEVIPLPDISHAFADYRYHPHNSVLGMLAFGGVVGFSGLWTWLSISIFLAVRAYRHAREPTWRACCLVAMAVFIAYANQCFGDMGTISWLGTILIAMAATCAGKMATLTGAWPSAEARRFVPENGKTGTPVGNPV
ncbi:exopolysaccharide repeat unit polymerase [Archangium primigenium]|uniref:exopolysaccharide repeat unit polymerase n=1 Tax=[Archangium] primigenium TaxID=2792470 RepID=UPI00195EE9CD|nr:exopolysaccharide repeat unit polymerase [Archangium primigenium]MBM7112365.1 O-antigen ligase family protein [Archangium primigenium]